jgi:cell division septation protein DedD
MVTASTPPAGAYVVQLVSNKSEAEAQAAFKTLQTKYPGVLGSRTALIRRVELGDKGTYYRAQVGPFANSDQANSLCDNLKAAGGQCIVQRN